MFRRSGALIYFLLFNIWKKHLRHGCHHIPAPFYPIIPCLPSRISCFRPCHVCISPIVLFPSCIISSDYLSDYSVCYCCSCYCSASAPWFSLRSRVSLISPERLECPAVFGITPTFFVRLTGTAECQGRYCVDGTCASHWFDKTHW